MDLLTLQTLSIEDPEATVCYVGPSADLREWQHARCAKYNYDLWVVKGHPRYAISYLTEVDERSNYMRYRYCSLCSRPLRVDNPR